MKEVKLTDFEIAEIKTLIRWEQKRLKEEYKNSIETELVIEMLEKLNDKL